MLHSEQIFIFNWNWSNIMKKNFLKKDIGETNFVLDQDTVFENLIHDCVKSVLHDFENIFRTKNFSEEKIEFFWN